MLANPLKKASVHLPKSTAASKNRLGLCKKSFRPYTGIPKGVRGAKQLVRKSPTAAKIAGGAKIAAGAGLGYEGVTRGY